jgi:transcription elongation factor SPT6
LAYAEQFEDSDPVKGQSPEELLRRARMILSTELGKDPLLRSQMRKLFKEEARLTVEPTERGITKIDENHPYFVGFFKKNILKLETNLFQELQIPLSEADQRDVKLWSILAYPCCRSRTSRYYLDLHSSRGQVHFRA